MLFEGNGVTALEAYAAWALIIGFALSIVYELWRATSKAGTSRHDSMTNFTRQDLPLYLVAAVVIGLLISGVEAAAWIGLVFSVLLILVSIFYYNPKIMVERQPGLIDWFEDFVYTGMLFVAATLLGFEVLGMALVSA